MRNSPRLLWLALGGAAWTSACQSAGWQLPGFPQDASELVRFQEQQQAGLAAPRRARRPAEDQVEGRLRRLERAQAELIEGLSAGQAGVEDAGRVGAELRESDARQAQQIGQLEQRLETELAASSGAALRELEAGVERDLIRLSSADREQLERLARVEQRAEQLTQRGTAAPTGRDWYWLFGLVSLGALPLVALWLWRGGRSRAQDQVDQLDQRLRELERPHSDPNLGPPRPLGDAAVQAARRELEPRPESAVAGVALAAAAAAGSQVPPETPEPPEREAQAELPAAVVPASTLDAAEPAPEDLRPFELPRRLPDFERRRPGLDPKHTAAPPLGLFANQAAPAVGSPQEAGAEQPIEAPQRSEAPASPGSPSSGAREPAADPAARRADFELELVRQLERRASNRAPAAIDPFEDFAARRRAALQSAAAREPQSAAQPEPRAAQGPARRAGLGLAQGPAEPAPDRAPQAAPPAAPASGAPPPEQSGGARAPELPPERSLRSMLLNAPWASLSPLPAAEQRQGRFESELERAFRALEQERLALEAEERQAQRPRSRFEDEEFLASEDEERSA